MYIYIHIETGVYIYIWTDTNMYVYIYIYIRMCVYRPGLRAQVDVRVQVLYPATAQAPQSAAGRAWCTAKQHGKRVSYKNKYINISLYIYIYLGYIVTSAIIIIMLKIIPSLPPFFKTTPLHKTPWPKSHNF